MIKKMYPQEQNIHKAGSSDDRGCHSPHLGVKGVDNSASQTPFLRCVNRHGLIAGATGTGKTIGVQILAEGFSTTCVPVFLSDAKGKVPSRAPAGSYAHKLHNKLIDRADRTGFDDFGSEVCPNDLWDLYGQQIHPA